MSGDVYNTYRYTLRLLRVRPCKSRNYNIIVPSNFSCQFAVEQHVATRRHEIGDDDGLHHEGLRLSDGTQPVLIHCQQFGAIGLSKRQQAQINEEPPSVVPVLRHNIIRYAPIHTT